jgi:DNA relaxase NicK
VCAKIDKKTTIKQKRTQYMCGKMLRWMRQQMKFEPRDMRTCLDIKSRRTYESYESGLRGIPEKIAVKVWDMYRRDCEFMANICHDAVMTAQPLAYTPSELLQRIQQREFEDGIIRI